VSAIDPNSALQTIAFAYEQWQNSYGAYLDVDFGEIEVEGYKAKVELTDEEGGDSTVTAYFDGDGNLDTMIDDCHGHLNVIHLNREYVGGGSNDGTGTAPHNEVRRGVRA
jgi:hypothetical protein